MQCSAIILLRVCVRCLEVSRIGRCIVVYGVRPLNIIADARFEFRPIDRELPQSVRLGTFVRIVRLRDLALQEYLEVVLRQDHLRDIAEDVERIVNLIVAAVRSREGRRDARICHGIARAAVHGLLGFRRVLVIRSRDRSAGTRIERDRITRDLAVEGMLAIQQRRRSLRAAIVAARDRRSGCKRQLLRRDLARARHRDRAGRCRRAVAQDIVRRGIRTREADLVLDVLAVFDDRTRRRAARA